MRAPVRRTSTGVLRGCLGIVFLIAALHASAVRAQTVLYLARHGESEGNRQGLLQGQTNSPLTQQGRATAEKLAGYFRDKRIDALYSSSLGRAMETAAIISDVIGVPVQSRDELREADFGDLENRPGNDPEVDRELERKSADLDYRPGGGESHRMHLTRVARLLKEILDRHRDQRVLLVAHGGTHRAAVARLMSIPDEQAVRLPSQPHERVYIIYRLSPDATTLLWDDVP